MTVTATVDGIFNDTGVSNSDGVTNNPEQFINITAEGATQVEVFVDGVSIGFATAIPPPQGFAQSQWFIEHDFSAAGDGTFEVTAQAGFPDPISVLVQIIGGPISDPFEVTIDTVAPDEATLIGDEFLVNTEGVGFQVIPAITALDNGGFVVSWATADSTQDESGSAIKAQIFDATGAQVGAEFLVNTEGESFQGEPAITALDNGGFVVSWRTSDSTQDGSAFAIKAKIFDATGAKVGDEFLVNTEAEDDQRDPAITALDNGGFVVSWGTDDSTQDGSRSAIKAQIFDATGAQVGAEFLVNTEGEDFQGDPAITALDSGGFVVSWETQDTAQDESGSAIKAQIFDATGAKVGAEFLVNTKAEGFQISPAITALDNGGFVVSWRTGDSTQDGSAHAIKAQIFDATGAQVGDEFLVNTEAEGNQRDPAITALDSGGFVVSWETSDTTQDGSQDAVKAQIFDATGAKVGDEFLVNTEGEDFQADPAITALDNGGFVVSWKTDDTTQDGSNTAIKAQIFDYQPFQLTGFQNTFGTPDNVLVNQNSFAVTGTGEPGATVSIRVLGPGGSDEEVIETVVFADGTWSASLAGINRPEGLNTIEVTTFDDAGNTSPTRLNGSFTVDNTAPTLSAIDLVDASDTGASNTDNTTSDTTPTISFTAEAGSQVEVNFGDGHAPVQVVGTGALQEVTLGTPYATHGRKTVVVATRDAAGNSTVQVLEITISAPPVATALALTGDEDTVISGTVLATDPDGDALTFSLQSGPANGTATVAADGSVVYTPFADFNGTDSFIFKVDDGNGGIDTQTVTVTVDPVADIVAVGGSVAGTPGQLNGNTFTSVDPGDKFTVNPTTPFTSGSVTVDPGTGQVTIPGASFTVDIDLTQNSFLVVQGSGGVSELFFLDVLQGNGADLLEGVTVDSSMINGIAPTGFLSATNSNTFEVTLDASQGTLANALGSFVRNADGSISDVKVLFGSGTSEGTKATVSVADGGTLEFFLIQDFGNSGITLSDDLRFDFSTSTPELVSDGTVLDLELFFSGDTSQNSDGVQHFLSGVVPGGGALRVGVEDLLGGGDQDYQDFVFTVATIDMM